MPKRVFAAIVGVVAMIAGAIALLGAVRLFPDFLNPAVPFHVNVAAVIVAFSWAFAAFAIGIRWLGFSSGGRSHRNTWATPIVIGVGCFFPAFLVSLPVTLFWARHAWPGDGQSELVAVEVSMYVGIAAEIVVGVVLFMRHRLRAKHSPA